MPSEPNWSKNISNSSVCTWFYALAIVNAFFAIAGIVLVLMSNKVTMPTVFTVLLSAGVGFTNAWFLFLVCNRGLRG